MDFFIRYFNNNKGSRRIVASDISFERSEEGNEAGSEWEEIEENAFVEHGRDHVDQVEKPVALHQRSIFVRPSSTLFKLAHCSFLREILNVVHVNSRELND